jgi:outer membrane protein assembly factor BamB
MLNPLTRGLFALSASLLCLSCSVDEPLNPKYHLDGPTGWAQWGKTAAHVGNVDVAGQHPRRVLASVVYDPFVVEERSAEDGDILVHYQTPLVDGADVFMEAKSGTYVVCPPHPEDEPLPIGTPPCGSAAWDRQDWSEKRFSWENGAFVEKWTFPSDWNPPLDKDGWLGGWEPVFHAALAGRHVLVPGRGGSVFVVTRESGSPVARVDPFGTLDPDTYVAGPITVDPSGNVYYHTIRLAPAEPSKNDIKGAFLVKVSPDGSVQKASFASLVPGAPAPKDMCLGTFTREDLPWPPSSDVKPGALACGAQRPGLNVAPAVGKDGTIYTVSRSHFASRYSYLVAVNPDLSPRWAASLRDRLSDGCGTPTLPPTGELGGCREGAALGVDPATNELPAGIVSDNSTSSPVIAPDGTILYGAYTRYNRSRGHLFQFSAEGDFLTASDFGWDVTPGIYEHDGTYSVVIKDNHYGSGSYCNDPMVCPRRMDGPFAITQLSSKLVLEWSFVNTNPNTCKRGPDGAVTCVADHPNSFEWCVNAPAIDRNGVVYANSEDGLLYAIQQGGTLTESLFLDESVAAAYTPLSIDAEGRIYAENVGRLFVIGE